MTSDPRVMAVSQARASHQPLTAGWPGGWKCSACDWVDRAIFWLDHLDEVAVAALDAFDNSGDGLSVYRRHIEASVRERIAQEIEAAHRTAPDCCAYDVAASIARRQG